MERTYGNSVPHTYDTITWGHSQGGHAAIWAGQMMDTCQTAAPNPALDLQIGPPLLSHIFGSWVTSSKRGVPDAADCTSVALFDSLRSASDGYCPAGGDRGHLELALFRKAGAASPAGHLEIPGQISAAGNGKSSADLTFTGSPLDRRMRGAFDRTLMPGCSATVLNP